jgi:hypothetical protein
MSDFTDLFRPKSDPKYLSPLDFIKKEWGNAQNLVIKAPAELKPVAQALVDTASTAVTAVEGVAGSAVGSFIASNAGGFRAEIQTLLQGAGLKGASGAAVLDGASAALTALQALVAHEVANFQAANPAPVGLSSSSGQPNAPLPSVGGTSPQLPAGA